VTTHNYATVTSCSSVAKIIHSVC